MRNIFRRENKPIQGRLRIRDIRPAAGDVVAGVSVALVVVPQSLAYAQLAGMPAVRGLYASAVPPLAAAPLSSSPYLQPGPTAISALLTFGALAPLAVVGSPEYVSLGLGLALVVGLVRVLVGVFRLGNIAFLLSEPMLLGFVPAASILIVSSQLPVALGAEPSERSVLGAALWALAHPDSWQATAAATSVAAASLLVFGRRLHRLVPVVLVVVTLGIGFSKLTSYSGATVGSISAGFPPFSLDLPWGSLPALLLPGTVIALLGFVEVASIGRTYASIERKPWDPDREFLGQGMANVAAAVAGGFPVGASFSRSALNRLSGARSSFSSIVTGLAVLSFLPFAYLLSPLPQALLATIVIVAVIGLAKISPILRLARLSRPQLLVAATTFSLTLALEPRIEIAVLVGVGLSIAIHLWRELQLEVDNWIDEDTLHLRPRGVLWFGSAARLEETLRMLIAQHPEANRLHVHLDALGRIDITGALALQAQLQHARESGLSIDIVDIRPRWTGLVENVIQCSNDPLRPRGRN